MPDDLPYINADRFGYLKCLNKIIYVGDYLEDGMTSNILNLAAKNIKGFIYEKKALQKEKLTFKHSIFNNIKYISYSLAANFSLRKIYNDSNNKFSTLILFLPTIILTRKRVEKIRKIRRSLKYSD